jgi:hypothetical protein
MADNFLGAKIAAGGSYQNMLSRNGFAMSSPLLLRLVYE